MQMYCFYGPVEDWVLFVNNTGIVQNMISSCTLYTNNGRQYAIATYWREA